MIWLRNGVVYLLSLVLFGALILGTVATSVYLTLGKSANVKAWLNQSGIYRSVIDTAIDNAAKSTSSGQSGSTDGVSVNDVAVQQAAKTVFSPALIGKNVAIVIDANYAWLQGKTATPQFTVDLSAAKQSFAQQVGQYVTDHLNGLPVCTAAQEQAMLNADPLTVSCRPASVSAETAGQQVTQKLAASDGFLSKPVITAATLNPNGGTAYYVKYSKAPTVYQAAVKAPWVFAVVALLSALGVLFISITRRKGWRRIATVFTVAGLLLVGTKFAAQIAMTQFKKIAFNNSNNGEIQHSLTNFATLLEKKLMNFDMYVGLGILAVALLIFIILLATKGRGGKAPKAKPATGEVPEPNRPSASASNTTNQAAATGKPVMDITGRPAKPAAKPQTAPTLPKSSAPASKPKRPRLIQ